MRAAHIAHLLAANSGGTAGFDPSSIPGYYAHVDASNGASITESSGTLTAISDLSSNDFSIVVTGTPRIGDTTQNGRNTIDFDGTERLTVGAAADWTFMSNFDGSPNQGEIWLVVKPGTVANPDDRYVIAGTNAGSTNNRGFEIWFDDRSANSRNDRVTFRGTRGVAATTWDDNSSADDALPANTFSLVRVTKDGDEAIGSRSAIYINDGAAITNGTATNSPSNSAPAHALDIGAGGNGFDPLIGSIAEALVFTGNMSSEDATSLRDSLNAKWNLW